MKTKIYGYQNNTGRITNYKEELIRDYNGGCAIETIVDIPDELNPYKSKAGNVCIDYNGAKFTLNEMLYSNKGKPGIHFCDMNTGRDILRMLKIIKKGDWVSCAITANGN